MKERQLFQTDVQIYALEKKKTKTREDIPQIGNIQTKQEESTEGIRQKKKSTNAMQKKSNSRKCELRDTSASDT